jgi:hypothetical protein
MAKSCSRPSTWLLVCSLHCCCHIFMSATPSTSPLDNDEDHAPLPLSIDNVDDGQQQQQEEEEEDRSCDTRQVITSNDGDDPLSDEPHDIGDTSTVSLLGQYVDRYSTDATIDRGVEIGVLAHGKVLDSTPNAPTSLPSTHAIDDADDVSQPLNQPKAMQTDRDKSSLIELDDVDRSSGSDTVIDDGEIDRPPTPLPFWKIFVLCIMLLCDNMGLHFLLPFVAFMVVDLGVVSSKEEAGYYGMLVCRTTHGFGCLVHLAHCCC